MLKKERFLMRLSSRAGGKEEPSHGEHVNERGEKKEGEG